ncbi:MAG: NAD+ synthase [Actinobacteria bacterium]|nr:NAD+ synthase [Actinomycetota bacterium]MCB9413659.1 NAD+ synthase [Actinomycetota bacterium]MCB9424635.1 NAD+ synthase [Actinomycetota bacterium]HRY10821.1 NAD+ synthase [Candidatus Nanopelagicales bacterium]
MAKIRIALAQVNPTVGDLLGNRALVVETAAQAAGAGADLVAFPEMMLTGYPIEDLALRPSFQQACANSLQILAGDLDAAGLGDLAVVVGHLAPPPADAQDRRGFNAAAVIHGGEVVADYAKHHLPNYGVFDEQRYFRSGHLPCRIRMGETDIALAICEDIWVSAGPLAQLSANPPGALLVINGSPYERNKDDVRLDLCSRRAQELGCAVAYVNMWGGQDELVFDGDSMVVDPDGQLVARAPQFVDHILLADLDLPPATADADVALPVRPAQHPVTATVADPLSDAREVYLALVTGLQDYVRKNGFSSVVLGMSGGIDSALVAAIACDALGAQNVYGVRMPSEYSSEHSLADAAESAALTGMNLRTVPITDMVQAYHRNLDLTGLAAENLQARVRGAILMGISNSEGHLVLATGNKSELAVGYSTIYGDAVGGFAPIKDVPKTLVWEMARWRNDSAARAGKAGLIPANSIEKPPSAELRPGQLDTDSLPDYHELDRVLEAYVGADMGATELLAAGFDPALVSRIVHLTDAAEWKRRQYPPGTKITFRAFGRDRRLPITNQWREPLD